MLFELCTRVISSLASPLPLSLHFPVLQEHFTWCRDMKHRNIYLWFTHSRKFDLRDGKACMLYFK